MKKVLIMLAAAALLIPAASSCKKSSEGSGLAPASIKDPASAIYQTRVQFKAGGDQIKLNDNEVITELELTKGGKFFAGIHQTKENLDKITTGKYSYVGSKAVTGAYELEGLGKFVIEQDGSGIKVTAEIDGKTYTATGTESSKVNTAGKYALAFQDWKVNSVTINVSGSGIPNISADYQGCDLYAIANDIKAHGVDVSEKILSSLQGYNVTSISLSEYGTFEIDFTEKDAFKGNYTGFNPNAGTLKYKFESFSENLVLAAEADVTLYWKTASLGLSIDGIVNYNDNKEYKAVIAFDLSPIF